MAANDPILGFYSGVEPDHRGRYLHEIQKWPDDQLESVHDYIQWLFPLPERSGFNVSAPVLNPKSGVHTGVPDSSRPPRESAGVFPPHDEVLRF
jgi:hypothetical protein